MITKENFERAIELVDGVTRCEVEANHALECSGDMPGLSLRVRVAGGRDVDVAKAIWRTRPVGYETMGEVVHEIEEVDVGCVTMIRFTRKIT